VDPARGSDSNSGLTAATALRSLAAAVARVPSLAAPRRIMLAAGRHQLNATLRLGTEHSHTTIKPADSHDEDAVVSGGVALDGLVWRKEGAPTAKGAQVYKATLPAGTSQQAIAVIT
jgi:hypothetical protein